MLGLFIAMIISGIMLASGNEPPTVFERATHFLKKWYITIAIVLMIVIGMLAISGSALLGVLFGGVLGGLIGTTVGAGFALMAMIYVAFAYILQILGATLMRGSLVRNADGSHVWDGMKLSVGIGLLLFGLIILPMS